MSATDHEVEQHTEPAERPVLRRTYTAEITAGDGRTVDVRVVPYGVSAEVSDDGGRNFYREEWAAGCFDDQLVAGHRLKVLLNFEHQRGISASSARARTAVASRRLHATFRMSRDAGRRQGAQLVRDGILDSVSFEAYAKKSIRTGLACSAA
jgi:phage head maturation protease